jgi:hypothetical protein
MQLSLIDAAFTLYTQFVEIAARLAGSHARRLATAEITTRKKSDTRPASPAARTLSEILVPQKPEVTLPLRIVRASLAPLNMLRRRTVRASQCVARSS